MILKIGLFLVEKAKPIALLFDEKSAYFTEKAKPAFSKSDFENPILPKKQSL